MIFKELNPIFLKILPHSFRVEPNPFKHEGQEVKENYAKFEPHEIGIIKAQNRDINPACSNVWAEHYEVQTFNADFILEKMYQAVKFIC